MKSGNQQTKYDVTQIFDQNTQQTIKDIEKFFMLVVKDKMYWTRDILGFFGIQKDDIPVFLNFHQIYKYGYLKKQQGHKEDENNVTDRAGSYWNKN